VEAPVERARAAEWLEAHLGEAVPDAATVVFHSIVMQYLPHAERDRVERALRDSRSRPLAWLRMEPADDDRTEVRLTVWPDGEERVLARAGYHGDPVEWSAGQRLRPPA
jgi:hypothetical protein